MDRLRFGSLLGTIILQCFIRPYEFSIQKREWIETTAQLTEGDVSCFSEYMEMWVHSARIEGLRVWLSGALRIQEVNLASLDHLNLQLSACGFSLHRDPDHNFVFRVSYTGCFVQKQHGDHVLTLNLAKRINRFGGRTHTFMMKCPVVSLLPSRERIKCDPEYIQVTRQVPFDKWDNESHWSLSLSDHLVVALEDASLIQMNVDMRGSDISVQGRRVEVLSPVKITGSEGEFLALKLVSGQYAYSMEATCPKVSTSMAEETVVHIFKRPMGLTRRGSHDTGDMLTVANASVKQTQHFTVNDAGEFVTLTLPTDLILQTKVCVDNKQLHQPFYRVDVVLTFKETNHKMHWTMENTLPCTAWPSAPHIAPSPGPHTTGLPTLPSTVPTINQRAPWEKMTTGSPLTNSPHTQVEASTLNPLADETTQSQSVNVSSSFDGDTTAAMNTTEISSFDFQNATVNTSAELGLLASPATVEPSETSATPKHKIQLFNTTRGQPKHRLKWIWED